MSPGLGSSKQETTPNLHTYVDEPWMNWEALRSFRLFGRWMENRQECERRPMHYAVWQQFFSFSDICFTLLCMYLCLPIFCCASSCTTRVEIELRPQKEHTVTLVQPRKGSSSFFFLLLSFLQIWSNKQKVGILRFSFITLIQVIKVKFCDCMSKSQLHCKFLSFLHTQQSVVAWMTKVGIEESTHKRWWQGLLGSPFSMKCEYCSLLSRSAVPEWCPEPAFSIFVFNVPKLLLDLQMGGEVFSAFGRMCGESVSSIPLA